MVADRFQLGARQITLISLRQVKNRGDRLHLHIRRQIQQGWTAPEEWLEIAVDHPTRMLEVALVFPKARPPQRAFLIEETTGAEQELAPRCWQVDREGRTGSSGRRNSRGWEKRTCCAGCGSSRVSVQPLCFDRAGTAAH